MRRMLLCSQAHMSLVQRDVRRLHILALRGEPVAHICGSLLLGIHRKSMCSSGCGTISCRTVCRVCVSCCGAYLQTNIN